MNQATKKQGVKVLYIGGDKGFWQTIQGRFLKQFDTIDWEFHTWSVKNELEALSTFINIIDFNPEFIYLDLSEHKKHYYPLGQLLGRDNFFHDIPVVGLIDKKEKIKEFLALSLDFIFVKGVELHDFVYHPVSIAMPKQVKKLDFALAKFNKEVDLKDDLRVGFITPLSIHLEGNLPMAPGEKVRIRTELPNKNVPSPSFTLRNIAQSNLYYPFQYAYDFDIDFVDPPEFDEAEQDDALGEEDEKKRLAQIKKAKENRREKIAEHEGMLQVCKKRHKDWVFHSMDPESEKATKVLFVDKWMRIFSDPNMRPIDQYKFGLRTQTMLSEGFEDIDQIRPNIIAIQLVSQIPPKFERVHQLVVEENKNGDPDATPPEYPDLELEPEEVQYLEVLRENLQDWEKAEVEFVANLIKRIKEINNYSPVIVLFNCYFQNKEALQESFSYPLVMVNTNWIKLDSITGMAQIFTEKHKNKTAETIKAKIDALKKKDPQKYRRLTADDLTEKKYFISKNSTMSFAEVKIPIKMRTLTESTVTFSTEKELHPGTFRTNFPVEMSVRLVNVEDGKFSVVDAGEHVYKGLIHSITEDEKKQIRRYINEVFFEPLMEKRQQEEAEYWEKHQQALADKENDDEIAEERAKETLGLNQQNEGEATTDEEVPTE